MIDVVILGAGGFARETAWVFAEANTADKQWNVLGYIDDNPDLRGTILCDLPVLGGFEWLERNVRKHFKVISAAGHTPTRKLFAERCKGLGLTFCTVIHPTARISRWVDVGPGTVITAGNILTTQIKVGAHVLLNLSSTVGHDTRIGDYCNINPGCQISGSVTFGEGVYFGTGAVIIQGKTVGDWSTIGAGAVVTTDIPANVTAVGVPCRVIKTHQVEVALQGRP